MCVTVCLIDRFPSCLSSTVAVGKGMDSEITKLGLTMVKYPVSPRFGKMLTLARVHSLIPYVIATVAVLTVPVSNAYFYFSPMLPNTQ